MIGLFRLSIINPALHSVSRKVLSAQHGSRERERERERERVTVSRAREYESERTHLAIPSIVCACVSRYAERRCATRCSLSLSLSTAVLSAKHLARDAMKRSVNYT